MITPIPATIVIRFEDADRARLVAKIYCAGAREEFSNDNAIDNKLKYVFISTRLAFSANTSIAITVEKTADFLTNEVRDVFLSDPCR